MIRTRMVWQSVHLYPFHLAVLDVLMPYSRSLIPELFVVSEIETVESYSASCRLMYLFVSREGLMRSSLACTTVSLLASKSVNDVSHIDKGLVPV